MTPFRFCPVWRFVAALALAPAWAVGAGSANKHFEIPSGPAETSFRAFSEQAAAELVFSVDKVAGVETKAVRGDYLPLEALQRMVAGTVLVAFQDARTGALGIGRRDAAAPTITFGRDSPIAHD